MVTRLGLYGGSRGLYGSFAGKAQTGGGTSVVLDKPRPNTLKLGLSF